jgi:hypothetical protein
MIILKLRLSIKRRKLLESFLQELNTAGKLIPIQGITILRLHVYTSRYYVR